MEIVVKFIFVILSVFISLNCVLEFFRCFQLEAYSLYSIYKKLKNGLIKYCFFWLLYIIGIIILLTFEIYNLWIALYIILLSAIVVFLCGNKFRSVDKIVFTLRVKRILLIWAILLLLFEVVFLRLPIDIVGLFICFFVPISYFLLVIAVIILIPVEKLIGNYYISKAKKKLSKNKKLITIGITGSFGKTSTKEILNTILSEKYNVLATEKSYNTPFGLTKTINEKLDNTHEIFIAEMGAKKQGDIKYLCEMIGVDCGIVTAVGRQHTNTFKGIEGVYKTKKELSDYLFNKPCVFNLMNVYTNKMFLAHSGESLGVYIVKKRCLIVGKVVIKNVSCVFAYSKIFLKCFYEYPRQDVFYAKNIELSDTGSVFEVWSDGKFMFNCDTCLMGEHNIINILLAISIANYLGIDNELIFRGVSKIVQIKARLEKFQLDNGCVVINNGYNSNIDSAISTLSVLKYFKHDKKVVITPGLVDTEDDFNYNRRFGALLSRFATDVIIVKEKNKNAIALGLANSCFDMNRVKFAASFEVAKTYISNSKGDTVFLIENDLPDNYK